ncbi:MAG TPA: SDR family oxidoreductase [Gaiellaceae bacterium]
MKILVFGGTKFLGRATVEEALERGHELTLFNRGQTNPDLFPEVEQLRGDRTKDLSALAGQEWDAVVDPSGYIPAAVRASAEELRDRVGRYLFVSTISVYADFSRGPSEDSQRATLEDGQPEDELMPEYENYGALKALAEDAVSDVYGDRALIVRPGLIVGPHDPTGRFTYWPHRIARGGEFLIPAPPDEPQQFVDVRDLAGWMVDLLEQGASGAFNATHPGISRAELVESATRVTGSDATPVWTDPDWLAGQGVGQWMELPLWVHDADSVGIHRADVSRAVDAGLTFRPLDDVVRGTLEQAATTDDAGLARERERELLEAWRD